MVESLKTMAAQDTIIDKADIAQSLFPKHFEPCKALLRLLKRSPICGKLEKSGYFTKRRNALPAEVKLISEYVYQNIKN